MPNSQTTRYFYYPYFYLIVLTKIESSQTIIYLKSKIIDNL